MMMTIYEAKKASATCLVVAFSLGLCYTIASSSEAEVAVPDQPLAGLYFTSRMRDTFLSLKTYFNGTAACAGDEYWCKGSVPSAAEWKQLKAGFTKECRPIYSKQDWTFEAPPARCDAMLRQACPDPRQVCMFGWSYHLGMEFHVAGRSAIRIASTSLWTAINDAARDLHWGFHHGAIAETTRLLAPAVPWDVLGTAMMDQYCGDRQGAFSRYQCGHAIGHGVGMVSAFTKTYAGTICDAMADSHRPTSDAMSCFHGGYIMEIVSAYYCFYEPGLVYGYRLNVDGHDPPQKSKIVSMDTCDKETDGLVYPSPLLYKGFWSKKTRTADIAAEPLNLAECKTHAGCAYLLDQCASSLHDEGAFMYCVGQQHSVVATLVHVHPVFPFNPQPDLPLLTSTYTDPREGAATLGTDPTHDKVIYNLFKGTDLKERVAMMCHLHAISCRAQEVCEQSLAWYTEEDRLPHFLQFAQQAPVPCTV